MFTLDLGTFSLMPLAVNITLIGWKVKAWNVQNEWKSIKLKGLVFFKTKRLKKNSAFIPLITFLSLQDVVRKLSFQEV